MAPAGSSAAAKVPARRDPSRAPASLASQPDDVKALVDFIATVH
jgi:hypothetical protein